MESEDFTVVMPVFNDWASMERLINDIDGEFCGSNCSIKIVAVDDGSTVLLPEFCFHHTTVVSSIICVRLGTNVGHQRAIATGLVWLVSEGVPGRTAVMDSDGEDAPAELKRLVMEAITSQDVVVVAQRSRRSETLIFKLHYRLYRLIFRALTGHSINFGNFMVIPSRWVKRLICDPQIWNNVAAAIIRSRTPIKYVATTRGRRYSGKSKMSFVNLLGHGLGAISVFAESVFIRVCLVSLALGAIAGVCAGAAVAVRLLTDLAIPGWTTNAVGFALLVSIQTFVVPLTMAFLFLGNRSVGQVTPKDHALTLIDSVVHIKSSAAFDSELAK